MPIIWTAAFMACMINTSPTYDTCLIVNAKIKYETENQCMKALANQMNMMQEGGLMKVYEFTEIKCIPWGDSKNDDV
jgi:hypothetical protein